jgi:hypothetical protein
LAIEGGRRCNPGEAITIYEPMRSKRREQKLAGITRRIACDVELLVDELERLRPELLEKAAPPQRFRRWGVLFGASLAVGAVGAVILRRVLERTVIDQAAKRAAGDTSEQQAMMADRA